MNFYYQKKKIFNVKVNQNGHKKEEKQKNKMAKSL